MAAKIYSAPEEVKQPNYDFQNVSSWEEQEETYIKEVKNFLAERGYTGKNAGEIIQFPVADGYAQYMVASMRPLMLVHLPLGDAWDWQFAHLLTAKEVQQKIDQRKALNELFNKK
jgi:hypothetical protein